MREPPSPLPPAVVGIGVAKKNIEALSDFFVGVPTDLGIAFVVVVYGDSAPLGSVENALHRMTAMAVSHVSNDTLVESNHVYVITSNHYFALKQGILRAGQVSLRQELRLPIDYFFRSLAEDLGEQAIGVLLSGTKADGLLGLQAIKEHNGLTFAQTSGNGEETDKAVDLSTTAAVDRVLEPAQIAANILECVRQMRQVPSSDEELHIRSDESDSIQRILACLHDKMGHDFSGYKENTISRRIHRRMMINRIEKRDAYARYLEEHSEEASALFHELLIGVTSFFRDPEAFAFLEERVIARLFAARREHGPSIRVWIPGCSTGEEAYSVAILLHEYARRIRKQMTFQIFATDIDPIALDKARAGRFPASIITDVGAERFYNYFAPDRDGQNVLVDWRLRDTIVFATQSIIKDPPFSRIDLICCRNLMIYFGPELQQKLLGILHYALNPGGYLFLGNSETLGTSQPFFRTIDSTWKFFQRQETSTKPFPSMPFRRSNTANVPSLDTSIRDRRSNLRDATEQLLLTEHTPTAIVVNVSGDMQYVHGRTGKFLEHATGDATTNILKVAREGLRLPLMTALHAINTHKEPQVTECVSIQLENELARVRLSVSPILKPGPLHGLVLVTLTEITAPKVSASTAAETSTTSESGPHVMDLERELMNTRQFLQATIEQLETTNEALLSSNEDLQSSNDELQSANEELQTSKEELQSVNEELSTVNTELENKIYELTDANNDIKNLLDNAQIGVIFLDSKLRIRRFTKAATEIVDLIVADIGRPLAQFVHRLKYDRLVEDARDVLETQQSKELELRATNGRWYLVRTLPYRTIDDHVDGVVLTFTDITPFKESHEKLEFLFNVLPVGVAVFDRHLKPSKWNTSFLRMNELDADDMAWEKHVQRAFIRPDGTLRKHEEFAALRVLAGESSVINVESGFTRRDGQMTWLDASAVASPFSDWSVIAVTTDITARKEAESLLQLSEEKFSKAFYHAPLMIGIIDLASQTLIDCNEQFLNISGYTREESVGQSVKTIGWVPVDVAAKLLEKMTQDGFVHNEEIVCRAKGGRDVDCLYHGFVIDIGGKKQVVSMIQDIGERKRREDEIKATLRQEKETVLRELAHRTKNNMFVIRSMLKLHAMHADNDEVRRLFNDVENKIAAMALVHQKLYQSKNLSRLDLGDYLRQLAPMLAESHNLTPKRVVVHVDAENISSLIDTAIPCGLVVTELITNAFKHAFPGGRIGLISVRLHRKPPDTILLEIEDDGVGVSDDFDFRRQMSLGLQTVFMIVEHQLRGTVIFSAMARGLACRIEFNDTLYSERV